MIWKIIVCWYVITDILLAQIISVTLSVVIIANNATKLNV